MIKRGSSFVEWNPISSLPRSNPGASAEARREIDEKIVSVAKRLQAPQQEKPSEGALKGAQNSTLRSRVTSAISGVFRSVFGSHPLPFRESEVVAKSGVRTANVFESQSPKNQSLILVFLEFMKNSPNKESLVEMLQNLNPEVKEAILSNQEGVLVLLRSKIKFPGNLQNLLSRSPINQQFVFSHAKVIFEHDEKHHKSFLELTLHDKKSSKDEKINLCGSIYEELLWVKEEEILDATNLIEKGFSPANLFELKEVMNDSESSISFSEIKRGVLAQEGIVGKAEFQNLSKVDQVLIILFMEFIAAAPDKREALKKLLTLGTGVKQIILMNKVNVLSLLRAVLSSSFTLEDVLSSSFFNQELFFSSDGIPCDFIDPSFYQNLLKMEYAEVCSISYIVREKEIELEDLFQMQMILAESNMTLNFSKLKVVLDAGSEGRKGQISELDLLNSALMALFVPFIKDDDKRPPFRKMVALRLDVKNTIISNYKQILEQLTNRNKSTSIEKLLDNFTRLVSESSGT